MTPTTRRAWIASVLVLLGVGPLATLGPQLAFAQAPPAGSGSAPGEAPPPSPAPTGKPADSQATAPLPQVDEVRARAAFDRGARAYLDGDFETAATEYTEATRFSRKPAYLFNLGQALRRSGRARDAVAVFRRFLDQA